MFRFIASSLMAAGLAALLFTPLASAQQSPGARPVNAQKLEKCKALARERGFLSGGVTKGAIKPRDFIVACMQGKVT